jgi:4-hydroxy-tetrahydrodipicolinate reductase
MKIGLIGYGKMGKAIELIAQSRGHEIVYRINSQLPIEGVNLQDADVAIEFTQPSLAKKHILACLSSQTPVVVGTTAWNHQLQEVTEEVKTRNGALLYASNFSIGVNVFFQLNERLAQLMSNHPEYNASIEEIHHIQKLDAPSGTAVSLAEGILKNHSEYTSWKSETGSWPNTSKHELPIQALREPNVPGTHTICYTSAVDSIQINHTAISRDGFALGAVVAAEYLVNKKGIFTMRDVLSI